MFLVISNFGFEGLTFVLIVLSLGHCLPFTFITTIVAEWLPSGKELLTQSLCNLYICNILSYFQFWFRRLDFCPDCTISRPLLTFYFYHDDSISNFGFEGWIFVLIVLAPGHCLLFTFIKTIVRFENGKGHLPGTYL